MRIKDILKKTADEEPTKALVNVQYRITKVDDDRQIVTGVVYSPWVLDSHGHYMSDVEIEKTAHRFLMEGRQKQVDVMHNNKVIDAVVVESYIERTGSREVPVGSWVASTKINDKIVWNGIKSGVINGYSMEIESFLIEHDAEIVFDAWVTGETQPDPFDGHTHTYLVKMDEEGNIERGFTSIGGPDNHRHTISRMSITDPYNKSTHRFII